MVRKCQDIFKHRAIRNCLRTCTHIKSWKKCWHHCTHHPVIHHHHRCVKKIIEHTGNKCSIKKVFKGCHQSCTTFPKQCFNICKNKVCGHSRCNCCKLKCTQRKPVCVKHCIEKQMKYCYLVRLPSSIRKTCWSYISKTFINTCLEQCVQQKYFYYTKTL